jgi:tRNA dimethylallyltransferase
MQVYRDLRILTARPDPGLEARVPHRLYGVLDGAELCSAARWREMALAKIEAAWAAGRVAVVCGGTGLYLRALKHGLAELPDIPDAVRQEARALHARLGGDAFRARLADRDPDAAARLPSGDSQRLIRAYEVVLATGVTLAEWQRRQRRAGPPGQVLELVLAPPRAELHAACNGRFRAMVDLGALAEVRALIERRLDPALPVMKALGVPELALHLSGEISLEAAIGRVQAATRQYAKRQTTWFRHQMPRARRFDAQYSERLAPEIFPFIERFLLTAEQPNG